MPRAEPDSQLGRHDPAIFSRLSETFHVDVIIILFASCVLKIRGMRFASSEQLGELLFLLLAARDGRAFGTGATSRAGA